MRKRYQYFILGKTGPSGSILLGALLAFVGWMLLLSKVYFWGGGILLLAIGLAFSFTAVRFDLQKMRIKHHINFLGLWFGRWESMARYPDIVVLNRKRNYGSKEYKFYDKIECSVYLMTANHLSHIRVYRCFDRLQANDKARMLSLLLNKDYVQYNPGMQFQRVLKY